MARGLLVMLCSLAWTGPVLAQDPCSRLGHRLGFWSGSNGCPKPGCCPDDYCRKPMPCITLHRCGGPDDYCRKVMPCLTDVLRCGGCDDYCRKTLPTLLCPPWSPALQCGPGAECCPPARIRFVSPPPPSR